MTRKIITLAATALSIGALSSAPLAAQASPVTVTATVASTATVVTTTDAATTTWTGAAIELVPFTLTVTSNDDAGYQFTFTGLNPGAGGEFALVGTAVPGNGVPYTINGTDVDGLSYTNGTLGTTVYPGPALGGVLSTFDVTLPAIGLVPSDTYVDTITAAVTPV